MGASDGMSFAPVRALKDADILDAASFLVSVEVLSIAVADAQYLTAAKAARWASQAVRNCQDRIGS